MVKVEYKFEAIEDFSFYLNLLIEHLDKYLIRYKAYHREIKKICLEKYQEIEPEAKEIKSAILMELMNSDNYESKREKFSKITYKQYIKYKDAVTYVQLKILNIIGDRTKEAASYNKFRDEIKRYNSKQENKIILDDLTQDIQEILNTCYRSRNYLAHTGDSIFISQREYRKMQKAELSKQLNIDIEIFEKNEQGLILVNTYDYVDIEWFFQLHIVYERALSIFMSIHQQMRRDLGKIIGGQIEIRKIPNKILPINYAIISVDSVNMQLNKKNKNV